MTEDERRAWAETYVMRTYRAALLDWVTVHDADPAPLHAAADALCLAAINLGIDSTDLLRTLKPGIAEGAEQVDLGPASSPNRSRRYGLAVGYLLACYFGHRMRPAQGPGRDE